MPIIKALYFRIRHEALHHTILAPTNHRGGDDWCLAALYLQTAQRESSRALVALPKKYLFVVLELSTSSPEIGFALLLDCYVFFQCRVLLKYLA